MYCTSARQLMDDGGGFIVGGTLNHNFFNLHCDCFVNIQSHNIHVSVFNSLLLRFTIV